MPLSLAQKMFLLESTYFKLQFFKRSKRVAQPIHVRRRKLGEFHHLHPKLKADELRFFNYYNMTKATFYYILERIKSSIEKKSSSTNFVSRISPEERLAVTLRFLATGCSYTNIAFSFRIAHRTISKIVKEVCEAIWNAFAATHMPPPTRETLENNAEDFFHKWGFPNCIGSIDKNNLRIRCPSNSGTMYKKYFLQGVSDAQYKFVCVEIGPFGKESDEGGIFELSNLYSLLESAKFNMPAPRVLPETDIEVPFVLIADETYPLKPYLMRPFPQDDLNNECVIFNEKLSKAQNTIGCAFGIVTNKWRVLGTAMETDVETTKTITKCVCLLHNIIIDKEGIDKVALLHASKQSDKTRQERVVMNQNNPNMTTALQVRNSLKSYFVLCSK